MNGKWRTMAILATLLLGFGLTSSTIAAKPEPGGIPTVYYGAEFPKIANSREWIRRALPSYCLKYEPQIRARAPQGITRHVGVSSVLPKRKVKPVIVIVEEEETRLGFTP